MPANREQPNNGSEPTEEELLTPTFVPARYPEKRGTEPLRIAMMPIFALGTCVWIVAFLLTVVYRDSLEADGRGWWAVCAAIGIALGILGTTTMFFRDRRVRQAREAERHSSSDSASLNTVSD
ncbi:DUF2530 domain-containing protein [Haloglycomyces albus]|uniref:DUF2530 domain-containing protein n=1 Tax=Haloglycomyces albus TaxID=526067 RepID=UPI0004ACE6C9|nr:DUF2530 domain-containing protein [Haloglycomyces albus]